MADGLVRYGYLPNPGSAPAGLPVGFMVARGGVDEPSLGLNTPPATRGRSNVVARAIASTAALRSPTSAPSGDLDAAVGRTLNDTANPPLSPKPCSAR